MFKNILNKAVDFLSSLPIRIIYIVSCTFYSLLHIYFLFLSMNLMFMFIEGHLNVTSCSLIEVYGCFKAMESIPVKQKLCLLGLLFNSEDGGRTFWTSTRLNLSHDLHDHCHQNQKIMHFFPCYKFWISYVLASEQPVLFSCLADEMYTTTLLWWIQVCIVSKGAYYCCCNGILFWVFLQQLCHKKIM
jgi:hypothetical protein